MPRYQIATRKKVFGHYDILDTHTGQRTPQGTTSIHKCFATEVMGWGFNNAWRSSRVEGLKYGEIGIPTKDQQRAYRCQMIDAMIYSGAVTHILIPTTLEGDSDFFK